MASQYRHALINAVSNLLVTEYSFFAVFALLVYDWLIFLDEEIDWFWDFPKGRRLTAASLLYGLSRYPPIFSELFSVVTVFRMSEVACIAVNLIQIIASLLGDVAPAIFSSIRVYALLQNKVIGILTLLLLAIPPLGAVVLNAADEKMSIQPKPFYCTNSTSFPLQLAHNLSIAARICSIVGELLVLFITLYKTRTFYAGEQPRVLHCGPSLTRIMLHNGTTYFMQVPLQIISSLSLSILLLYRGSQGHHRPECPRSEPFPDPSQRCRPRRLSNDVDPNVPLPLRPTPSGSHRSVPLIAVGVTLAEHQLRDSLPERP